MARRIAISGASGFIGGHLCAHLRQRGDTVLRLVRRPTDAPDEISWIPTSSRPRLSQLEGLDAFVHLAGAPIATGRWTQTRRRVLRDSRAAATGHVARALAQLQTPPRTFVQMSAIGLYGSRSDEVLDESSSPGTGFLAELAQAWEPAGEPFDAIGRRVVLRLGMVLAADGGALGRLLPIFRMGLGGRLGNGKQWVSWIAMPDLLAVIDRAIDDDSMHGVIATTAPTPVTNALFTQAIGAALKRPTFCAVPAMALRMMLGDMADELLLGSQRVVPTQLLKAGFTFQSPTIDVALAAILTR